MSKAKNLIKKFSEMAKIGQDKKVLKANPGDTGVLNMNGVKIKVVFDGTAKTTKAGFSRIALLVPDETK